MLDLEKIQKEEIKNCEQKLLQDIQEKLGCSIEEALEYTTKKEIKRYPYKNLIDLEYLYNPEEFTETIYITEYKRVFIWQKKIKVAKEKLKRKKACVNTKAEAIALGRLLSDWGYDVLVKGTDYTYSSCYKILLDIKFTAKLPKNTVRFEEFIK